MQYHVPQYYTYTCIYSPKGLFTLNQSVCIFEFIFQQIYMFGVLVPIASANALEWVV